MSDTFSEWADGFTELWREFDNNLRDLAIMLRRNGWNAPCRMIYTEFSRGWNTAHHKYDEKPHHEIVQVILPRGFVQGDALEWCLISNGYSEATLSIGYNKWGLEQHIATISIEWKTKLHGYSGFHTEASTDA